MRIARSTVFIIAGLILGCQTIQVSQDYDVSKNFSALKTYEWQSKTQPATGDIRVDNPLLDARIRSAVDGDLSRQGYQRNTSGKADFYVSYKYQIRRRLESGDVGMGVGFGWGGRGHFGGIGVGTGGDVSEYEEGMLVIDFTEASTGGLLWRGVGSARIAEHAKPAEITEGVNAMVERILSQFPPLPQ